jgi:SAM-dependent methyltransferase
MSSNLIAHLYRILRIKDCYLCPICNYYGRFLSYKPETGERKKAICPRCGAFERHRLQYLVFKEITQNIKTQEMSMLHFAPEQFFREIFKDRFGVYTTADLNGENVDRKEDLTHMSFSDNSFDFFYASHVLEHIKNDLEALSEIRRVLKPKGIAILPVPIISDKTIEYNEPNPHECDHVRCPGSDYYERYKKYFSEIKLYRSSDFEERYQLYIHEDRNIWPNTMPLRPSTPGSRHLDIVPVCYR